MAEEVTLVEKRREFDGDYMLLGITECVCMRGIDLEPKSYYKPTSHKGGCVAFGLNGLILHRCCYRPDRGGKTANCPWSQY